ncbi:hypothetical protein AGMMS49975_30190 [Clostridia bacterium]|nr:hypothetical protein AGMMS49975_30190 [Clostridia bacterium]
MSDAEIERFNNDPGAADMFKLGLKNAQNYQVARMQPVSGGENQRARDEHLERRVVSDINNGEPVYFVSLDIDKFKNVNDTYNHLAGDTVIKHVFEALEQNVRSSDKAYHLHGEEMILIMHGGKPEEIVERVDEIREKLANTPATIIDNDGHPKQLNVTASFGVSQMRTEDVNKFNIGDVHKEAEVKAEATLYVSKSTGRNCVTVSPGLCVERDLETAAKIENVLRENPSVNVNGWKSEYAAVYLGNVIK